MFYRSCTKCTSSKVIRYLLVLLCVFSLSDVAVAKTVKVGVYSNKPLVFKDEQGIFQGLSIDILRYIAEQEDWQLEYVEGNWQETLSRLKSGEIDIQTAIAATDERKQIYDYSEQSLITNWGKVYRHLNAEAMSIIGLNGKSIALVSNDIHSYEFIDLMHKFNVNLKVFSAVDYDDVLKQVASGSVDVGVVSRLHAMQHAEHFGVAATPMIFNPIEVLYAVPKGLNGDLLQAIDRHLAALREEKDSVYYHSLDQWFDVEEPHIIPAWVKPALIVGGGLLLATLLISLLLKRQVAIKTGDLRTIFETSPAAIFIQDMQGDILDINQTALDMYGVGMEEGLQLSMKRDYSSAEYPKDLFATYWKETIAGKPQQFEWMARRSDDNSKFQTRVNLEKISFAGSDAVYTTVLDISEEKAAEKKLASSEKWLSVTLRSIGDGVITTDIKGNVILINKVAEDLTGWHQQEAAGMPIQKIFIATNAQTGEPRDCSVAEVLLSGQIIRPADQTMLIARDGSQRNITKSGAPIYSAERKVIGVVLVFRDVTEQKRVDDERKKLDKLESLGVLAGGIAHDFNNILVSILSNVELAALYTDSKSEAHPLLLEAKKASVRARDLTGQLLTFAKGGEPVKKAASLDSVITDTANFVLHGSSVQCHYHIPEGLWQVSIDTGQISRVIQNLVINARQAMPDGGSISIACENIADISAVTQMLPDGKYVRLTIADTGTGIPNERLEKIFDPYFSTKKEGSGLGLASCYSIIQKHNGWIYVDSSEHNGTTFTIYLPASIQEDENDLEASNPQKEGMQDRRKATIMIMDDDAMVRDATKQSLAVLGYDVLLAEDGREAIDIYLEHTANKRVIDVIIMDLTIPDGLSGTECIAELLKIDPQVKAVVVSGYSNDPVMAHYRDYGFVGSIAKPFELSELDELINKIV